LIISRTPFRLPLGGGGTDLPSYYKRYGGFFVSGAIEKYMHIALNRRFEEGFRVSYSVTELTKTVDEIKHPVVREALKMTGVDGHVEIVSIADAPASTGLGSSGSFCVGLLNVLYAYKGIHKTPDVIAEEACDIAMNRLDEPSGKQDEYVASFGGIKAYEVDTQGRVKVREMKLDDEVISELEHNLLMFYTGIKRDARDILSEQQRRIISGNSKKVEKAAVANGPGNDPDDAVERMHTIKRIGIESARALEKGDLRRFGELLDEHWKAKRGITSSMSNDKIDRWYSIGKSNGAIGAKLIGAGGGGFMLFYCEDGKHQLRKALVNEGLEEHRFRFDFSGSKIIYNV
jgi:D-glycero-alpha-D-manno-heptose-7-phosphate kinase